MAETVQLNSGPTGLTELAAKIKTLHAEVVEAGRTAVQKAMEAGVALLEAKKQVGHGAWLRWLKDNCELSERTAEIYMTVARNKPAVDAIIAAAANMTLVQVLRAIKPASGDKGGGTLSGYDKAQATLLKKLRALPLEDVDEAVKRTTAALTKVVAETKRPMTKAAA
jgi:mannose/cellobiose epimerase-like protein (N-acyl-D-glucosamine 2-epimerase family)